MTSLNQEGEQFGGMANDISVYPPIFRCTSMHIFQVSKCPQENVVTQPISKLQDISLFHSSSPISTVKDDYSSVFVEGPTAEKRFMVTHNCVSASKLDSTEGRETGAPCLP